MSSWQVQDVGIIFCSSIASRCVSEPSPARVAAVQSPYGILNMLLCMLAAAVTGQLSIIRL